MNIRITECMQVWQLSVTLQVGQQSKAAMSMCLWVRAMDTYATVYRIVEPKRKILAEAQAALDASNAALAQKQAQLQAIKDKVAALQQQLTDTQKQLAALQFQASCGTIKHVRRTCATRCCSLRELLQTDAVANASNWCHPALLVVP